MDKTLKLYIYVDGVSDTPFPQGAEEPLEIGAFRYDAKRMGGAPTITATVSYPTCLDKEWNDLVYTELNGEKYFLKQTPTSTLSNEDARYKHDLVMVAERVILDDAYFFDAVVGNPLENDKPVTNSTNFNFYGSIEEFVKRMNASLQYTKLQSVSEDGVISGYRVILDDDIVTREQKQVVFDGAAFSQALQECYNTFGIPFYFDGKEIHVGYTNNVISDVLEYGVDGALLSASKQNANFKVVNRATGMGSSDNIPYYYPNNAPKGEIQITASESNQGITTEDIEIRDTEVFSQSELRVDEIYTYHGSGKVSQSIEAKVLSTEEVSSFDENTVSLLQVHTTKNNPEKIEVEFLLNFDGHGDADIDLNWSLNIPQYYIYSQNENRDYTSSSHLALEVEGVYLSTNDAEYEELTYTKKEEKTRYLQWCKVNKDYADMTQEGHALRQIGLTIQTPNILGVARIKVVSKLKTVGVFWESLVPSITNPSCDITYNAEVRTHITGGWKSSMNDTTINMDACGVRFLKNPVYGDSFSWTIIEYIKTATNLQPSIYRATKGAERFYNAINYPFIPADGYELKYGEYIKDGEVHNDAYKKDNGEYYEFTNEYKEARPREHVFTVDDIKPTIKEMTNDISWSDTDSEGNPVTVFQRIDMFSEFAYDRGDNDETYIDENNETSFKHPYFFAKLRKLDFNLFDCAIEQQPMTISMTAGHCGACNFEVGVSEEYPRMNPVQVDENGNLVYDEEGRVLCGLEDFQDSVIPQDEQQDTINHEVWIALKKEETTYGILMPKAPKYEGDTLVEAGHRPKACSGTYSNDGDTFVILGINLPEEYVLHAERKLEKAIVKYIWENNVEKFNFSVNFSRIFLAENPRITDLINENARLTRVKYNGDEYMLYVSSYSYVMNEGDVLPEIRVELDDTLTMSQNALQNAINEVRSEIGQAIDALDVAAIGSRYFLRKDVDDVAQATIDFRKGVFFGEGGDVSVYEDGSAKLTIDYLEVTKKATFTSLEIQEKTHAGGQILLTPAAMICNEVEELEDSYRCYFQTKGDNGEEIFNQFVVGDQAISQTFNEWGGHYYWRYVVGVGENYIDLSKTDCDEESDAPSIGDKIIQLGNRTNEERQNAIVIAAYGEGSPYIIQYKGINGFALSEDKIVTKLSSTENIFTGKVHMEAGSGGLETIPEWIEVRNTANEALEKAGSIGEEAFAELEAYIDEVRQDLQEQIDGAVDSYFEDYEPTTSSFPAKDWDTEEEKSSHLNDTFTNLTDGRSWRWAKVAGNYTWVEIADTATSEALKLAGQAKTDSATKMRMFVDTPFTPYSVGDLWSRGESAPLMRCINAKDAGPFNEEDWELADNSQAYTDEKLSELKIGTENLLRNSGFTGDYLSEGLADESVLEGLEDLYSRPFDHWDTNIDVYREELPNDAISGYGVRFEYSSISQQLFNQAIAGSEYVVSFKAKSENNNGYVEAYIGTNGVRTETTSEWATYSMVLTPSSNTTFFQIGGNAIICDLKLEKGNKATSWSASPLDNRSDRAYYQSLKYVQNAFEGATDVNGGLVLTEQIQVGDYDKTNKEWVKMNGGMSGIYEGDNDVAFWAGGNFEKAVETAMVYENDPNYRPTEQELAAMANFVVTHGGRAILNEAIVRGSVYANEGNFGRGCTIGDTVRVVDGGIEIDSHVEDIEGKINIDESNGISCSNTKFYASLGGSGCGNSMFRVGTVSSGGTCPNNPTPIIVSGDTDAIYCYRGSFAGLRPKCCYIGELYSLGGYYLRDDIFSVLFPSSGTYNIDLDDLFDQGQNHPQHGHEIWFETMGADINVTSTIPMWAHYYGQYQTSHTFTSAGVIRFKYYGSFSGQPNGIWTYTWVETK